MRTYHSDVAPARSAWRVDLATDGEFFLSTEGGDIVARSARGPGERVRHGGRGAVKPDDQALVVARKDECCSSQALLTPLGRYSSGHRLIRVVASR
jgi:hypothetical protein